MGVWLGINACVLVKREKERKVVFYHNSLAKSGVNGRREIAKSRPLFTEVIKSTFSFEFEKIAPLVM